MKPNLLTDFTGDYRPSGDQLNFEHCPVCDSAAWKVYVNPETGGWFCFAGEHHAGGTVEVELSGDEPGLDLLKQLDCKPVDPVWSETELPPNTWLSNLGIKYLHKRGLNMCEINTLGMNREWENQARILIPYFDDQGQLIFWNSRTYLSNVKPKYLSQPGKKPLYEPRLPGRDPNNVVLVEGPFDAIAVARAGYTAIALGGKSLPQYHVKNVLTKSPEYGTLWVLLDNDALLQAIELQDGLISRIGTQINIRFCPPGKDPGDMTSEEIQEVLR